MRIFDIFSDHKKITCFTFLEDNKIIKSFYETEFDSLFRLSENSDEIAIISEGCLNIITINDRHEFKSPKMDDKKVIEILN